MDSANDLPASRVEGAQQEDGLLLGVQHAAFDQHLPCEAVANGTQPGHHGLCSPGETAPSSRAEAAFLGDGAGELITESTQAFQLHPTEGSLLHTSWWLGSQVGTPIKKRW